jgi:magnesium chelatase family protein
VVARTVTHAVVGLEARRVEVEAHLEEGVPTFAIVGLADRACQEAKHRVRSGIASAELEEDDPFAVESGGGLLIDHTLRR